MKHLVTSICLILLSCAMAFAQRTVVSGIVLDSLSREGEPSAVLQFFKAPDYEKPIAFTTADADGRFSQVLSGTGDYQLMFTNVGRKTLRKAFRLNGESSLDLGEILIQDDVETLQAGSVVAMRPHVKMEVDRMTYDVANDVDSKTSTVLDMLRKVPMVSVDAQDNITVNGSSSFQVYVDGKPNTMMSANPSVVFKMMPASAIKDISVVTNPGVRYDAEGVGGVLQITTNAEITGGSGLSDGYYGSLTGNVSTRGGGAGVFYSQQKGRFAASLTGNIMYADSPGTRTDMERTTTAGMTTRSHSDGRMDGYIAFGNLNLSYEIDSLNLVSATGGLMGFLNRSTGTGNTAMSMPGLEFAYDSDTWSRTTRNSLTASVDYQHLWANSPKRSLVFSYQFSGSPSMADSRNQFHTEGGSFLDLTDRKTDGKTNSTDHTLQADFTTPVDGVGTISTGAKYLSRHNSSDQQNYLWNGSDWAYNAPGSTIYNYYNRIAAAYAELGLEFGKVGIKAGVRYEHTWQSYDQDGGSAFRTDYGTWVPTASMQVNLSDNQNIGLSYNLRISRPGITYLNPWRDDTDPTALSYGNPDLEVEKGNTVNLVYNYFSSKLMLNVTGRYAYTGNGISPYEYYQDNILHSTYGNIVKSSVAGLNAYAMWNASSKTRIVFNGGINYNDIRSDVLEQSNDGWNYSAMLGLQQTLPWDLRLSANVTAMSRTYTLQGWSSGFTMGNLGLTKTFLDDRLSLSLSAFAPLDFKDVTIESFSQTKEFTNYMTTAIPLSQATFSVSWTFGRQGSASVKRARRTISNEEVINTQSTTERLNSSGALGGGASSLPSGM